MPPHVLFLTYHLPLEGEPGAFRPWMEARLLAEVGLRVTVVTSGVQYMTGRDIRGGRGWCVEEEREGIRILRVWAPADYRRSIFRRILNYGGFTFLAGLAALVRVGPADRLFVGTDPIVLMPAAYLLSLVKRAKLVLDERDLYPETALALGVIKEGLITRTAFWLQQFFRRRALGILTATPGIARRLIGYGHDPDKVRLLYNGDVYLREAEEVKPPLDLRQASGRRFLAGYVGGLGRANDVATLLRAAVHLRDLEDVGVIVVGAGDRREALEKYAVENGLTNVFFHGPFPRREARSLISQLDVCVQPLLGDDHFNDTLTSKTFDYLGLGKPMLFCGRGDTAEVLAASGGGVSLPSGDAAGLAALIRELKDDPARLAEMGRRGREWFETEVGPEKGRLIMRRVMGLDRGTG